MKKLAILAVCLASGFLAYGQGGTINFANKVTAANLNAPVFAANGSTKLDGSAFLVQLYAGPSASALKAQGAAIPFRSAAAAGYWTATATTLDNVAPGADAFLQVRAWRVAAGATYDAAFASTSNDPIGNYGFSKTFSVKAGGVPDPTTGIPGFPANMTGLESFNLIAVPEPSVIALGVLGAGVLFLRRRK